VYAHGGGFVYGGNGAHMHMLSLLSRLSEAEVIAVDYRTAPEHPFPRALEDINSVIDNIECAYTLAGDSAGGNLALSTALRRRDRGMSAPQSIVALSPCFDSSFSNPSISENASLDKVISKEKLRFFLEAYALGSESHPYVSPQLADISGLPPVLLHASTSEILYDDARIMHERIQAANGSSQLYSLPLWHVWHMFSRYVPEARESIARVADFIVRNDSH
jgi:acetyl esterase/lipase